MPHWLHIRGPDHQGDGDALSEKRDYGSLGRRGQIGRSRALAREALARFGVVPARMTLLRHEHNTTFRVDATDDWYVLRMSRTGTGTPETIASEMAWLAAIRTDTNLSVPEPVAAPDGALVVVASHSGVPEARSCVLLRWMNGRFLDDGLTPPHLRRVGELIAGLQDHADRWARPAGFIRPRVDTLTSPAKLESIASSPIAPTPDIPSSADVDRALGLAEDLLSASAARTFAQALEVARATTRQLATRQGSAGLIHADLHYENYLFRAGEPCAIDFDDCGWGFHLYDLAVAIWELESRPEYPSLRDTLLDGYARHRPLGSDADVHLRAFAILRRVQILMWILESRDHATFRDDWRSWAGKELRGLEMALARS